MIVCRYGTPEMAHFLLDEDADPHWESADCHANALHCACIQGNLDIIRRLILDFEVRTVTRTRCIERGNEVVYKTPLELAKVYHHDDVAAFIIDPHW